MLRTNPVLWHIRISESCFCHLSPLHPVFLIWYIFFKSVSSQSCSPLLQWIEILLHTHPLPPIHAWHREWCGLKMNLPDYPRDRLYARHAFSILLCSCTLLQLDNMLSYAHWSPGVVTTTAGRVAAEYRNLGRDTPWLGNTWSETKTFVEITVLIDWLMIDDWLQRPHPP